MCYLSPLSHTTSVLLVEGVAHSCRQRALLFRMQRQIDSISSQQRPSLDGLLRKICSLAFLSTCHPRASDDKYLLCTGFGSIFHQAFYASSPNSAARPRRKRFCAISCTTVIEFSPGNVGLSEVPARSSSPPCVYVLRRLAPLNVLP